MLKWVVKDCQNYHVSRDRKAEENEAGQNNEETKYGNRDIVERTNREEIIYTEEKYI